MEEEEEDDDDDDEKKKKKLQAIICHDDLQSSVEHSQTDRKKRKDQSRYNSDTTDMSRQKGVALIIKPIYR